MMHLEKHLFPRMKTIYWQITNFSIFGLCDLVIRWPIFKLQLKIIKATFLTIFQDIWTETLASRLLTRFFYFSSCDLVCHLTWPRLALVLDITEINILTKFEDNWGKNVTDRALTRFYHIWAVWPSLWPQVTHILTSARNHQNNLSYQGYLDWNISL